MLSEKLFNNLFMRPEPLNHRIVRVWCDHCQKPYIYQTQKPLTDAAAHLRRLGLTTKTHLVDTDPAPCPRCGRFPTNLARNTLEPAMRLHIRLAVYLSFITAGCWALTFPHALGLRAIPFAYGSTALTVLSFLLLVPWLPRKAEHLWDY